MYLPSARPHLPVSAAGVRFSAVSGHGWHAARRGLGSNLYALGVPEKVIQQILRHANVSTTATYYIKTVPSQVTDAMEKLEQALPKSLSGNARNQRHGIPCH